MRAAVVLGGLSSVAIILHGCGSGAGGESKPCVDAQFQLVSQSWDATTTINVSGWNETSSPEKYVWTQNLKMNLTEKIDVDNVNMYASVSSNLKLWDKEGVEQPIHLQEKMIFNAAKKEAVMKVVFSGKEVPVYPGNCSKISIPNLPQPTQLSQTLKLIASSIGSKMTCGNDGTYDSWNLALTLPDKSIPIPQDDVTGNIKETIKLDRNSVLHSTMLKTELHVNVPNGTSGKSMTVTESEDMITSDSKPSGPSASDLDYSDWGECAEIKPPPQATELLSELSKSLSPHESLLAHTVSKSVFFRAIMQAAQQDVPSAATELVTV